MKPPEIPHRDIYTMKCTLYYRLGRLKIPIVDCDNVQSAFEWCKKNCEARGLFDFYYEGNQVLLDVH